MSGCSEFWGVSGGDKCKSGKAGKRMDRVAPNSVCTRLWIHVGMDIVQKQFDPQYHTAAFWGGFRGSAIQKPGKCGQTAGPIANKCCTYNAGESGNGHRLNKLAP